MMGCPELIEVKDGLLASEDKVIMKAREPSLFPDYVLNFFSEKDKIPQKEIDIGLDYVKVKTPDRRATFDTELFEYVKGHGRIECYLSKISIPGEYPCYPLFAKYRHGWVVLSPLEV